MKFVVKWGVYKTPHSSISSVQPNEVEQEFSNYEDAKRFKSMLVSECVHLGTSFYTKPIIEVEE